MTTARRVKPSSLSSNDSQESSENLEQKTEDGSKNLTKNAKEIFDTMHVLEQISNKQKVISIPSKEYAQDYEKFAVKKEQANQVYRWMRVIYIILGMLLGLGLFLFYQNKINLE